MQDDYSNEWHSAIVVKAEDACVKVSRSDGKVDIICCDDCGHGKLQQVLLREPRGVDLGVVKVGQQVAAFCTLDMGWYTASVCAIDDHNQMVIKNFRRQYDEWIPRNSQRRPAAPPWSAEEISGRRADAAGADPGCQCKGMFGSSSSRRTSRRYSASCASEVCWRTNRPAQSVYALSECACAVLVQGRTGVDLEKGETRFVCARCVADNSTAPVLDVMGAFLQSLQSAFPLIRMQASLNHAHHGGCSSDDHGAGEPFVACSGHDTLLQRLVSVLG